MQYCEKCKVKIKSKHTKCPLCQGELKGQYDKENQIFPDLKNNKIKYHFLSQLFTFICISIIVILIVINIIVTPDIWWSMFVSGGVLLIWISFTIGISKRSNLLKNALWQLFLVSSGSVICDINTNWHMWSVNYVIPSICVVTIIFMIIICIIQKLKINYYMVYFVIAGLFGIIPIIFIFTGISNVLYPSVICSGISFLLLTGLFIFYRKALIDEIYKKLHV